MILLGEELIHWLDKGYWLPDFLDGLNALEEGPFYTSSSVDGAVYVYRNESKTDHVVTLYKADESDRGTLKRQRERIRNIIGVVKPSLPIRVTYKRYCGNCYKDFRLFQIVEYIPIDNDSFCSSCIQEIRKRISCNTVPSIFIGNDVETAKNTVLSLLASVVEENEWGNDPLRYGYEAKYPGEFLSGSEGLVREVKKMTDDVSDKVYKEKEKQNKEY